MGGDHQLLRLLSKQRIFRRIQQKTQSAEATLLSNFKPEAFVQAYLFGLGRLFLVCIVNTMYGQITPTHTEPKQLIRLGRYLDQKVVAVLPGNWLRVSAPDSEDRYQFQHRSWEATVGLILSLIGAELIAVIFWPNTLEKISEQENKCSGAEK